MPKSGEFGSKIEASNRVDTVARSLMFIGAALDFLGFSELIVNEGPVENYRTEQSTEFEPTINTFPQSLEAQALTPESQPEIESIDPVVSYVQDLIEKAKRQNNSGQFDEV